MSRKASPRFWLACCVLSFALSAPARPDFNTDIPLSFFTNVANRLLLTLPAATYGRLSVTNIPVYPTNQYTPAVHRLLQLTANLYDATTNRPSFAGQSNQFLPSVFRPVFTKSSTNIWVSGYVEVTNDAITSFNIPCAEAEFLATNTALPNGPLNYNVYNVPWILGAKTGLPNFNEFELLNGVQVARRLEFQRLNLNGDPNDPANVVAYTNQLFILTLTNSIGNEVWNSYGAGWNLGARPLRMILTNEFTLSVTNTNNLGFTYLTNFSTGTNYLVGGGSNNVWSGYVQALPSLPAAATFRVPLTNSMIVAQANVISLQSPSGFPNVVSNRYITSAGADLFPLPRWQVNLNTRVRYALIDENAGQIVDYVSISRSLNPLDLAWELAGETNGPALDSSANGAWYTNGLGTFANPTAGPSAGLWNQMLVCLGDLPFNSSVYTKDTPYGFQFFAYNMGFIGSANGDPTIYKTNVFYSPYDPFRAIYQRFFWEANDPVVHYTTTDLTDPTTSGFIYRTSQGVANVPPGSLGKLNKRYKPWGNPPGGTADANGYNLALKDSLQFRSDNWNFPTNKSATVDWLGRVHRGTPWQTIYLKSGTVDLSTWENWTGNSNDADAAATLPTNDWKLVSLLVSLLNTNDPRPLLPVNKADTNSWAAVFDGLIALTNTSVAFNGNKTPTFAPIVLSSNDPTVLQLVAAVSAARTTNFNGRFQQIGDILSVPMLSVASPYLETSELSGSDPESLSVNDEAFEKLPAQLLTRLRLDPYGTVTETNNNLQIQFTGDDGYSYAVETSSNFANWSSIGTNAPQGGQFQITQPLTPDSRPHVFRSELLP